MDFKDIKSPGGFDSWDSGHAAAEIPPKMIIGTGEHSVELTLQEVDGVKIILKKKLKELKKWMILGGIEWKLNLPNVLG